MVIFIFPLFILSIIRFYRVNYDYREEITTFDRLLNIRF